MHDFVQAISEEGGPVLPNATLQLSTLPGSTFAGRAFHDVGLRLAKEAWNPGKANRYPKSGCENGWAPGLAFPTASDGLGTVGLAAAQSLEEGSGAPLGYVWSLFILSASFHSRWRVQGGAGPVGGCGSTCRGSGALWRPGAVRHCAARPGFKPMIWSFFYVRAPTQGAPEIGEHFPHFPVCIEKPLSLSLDSRGVCECVCVCVRPSDRNRHVGAKYVEHGMLGQPGWELGKDRSARIRTKA